MGRTRSKKEMEGKDVGGHTEKRVTHADVARLAGVSKATVSLVLGNRYDVAISDATRERVKSCANSLKYVCNRFLHGRTKLVGVLVLADYYLPFLDCFAGIQEELAKADYVPINITTNWLNGRPNPFPGKKSIKNMPGLRRLLEYQVDGVLYFSTDGEHAKACAKELSEKNIPMVTLGGMDYHEVNVDVDVVGGDNWAIGRMVAEHLLSVGCKSFAFGMPADSYPLDEIVRSSFVSRLQSDGYDCGNFVVGREGSDDLGSQLSQLLKPPAGVFCGRDGIAALALRAAFSLGWQVPHDFAAVGMGLSAISQYSILPISTVGRNSFDGGKAAAKLLLQRIEGFADQPQRILIKPSLTVRESSASNVPWLLSSDIA